MRHRVIQQAKRTHRLAQVVEQFLTRLGCLPGSMDAMIAGKANRQAVKVLGQQSGIGRPIEDMPDEFREWVIDLGGSGYVARYRLDPDEVVILAVRHQREAGYY